MTRWVFFAAGVSVGIVTGWLFATFTSYQYSPPA